MVENAVDNYFHSARMNFFHKVCEIGVAFFKVYQRGSALYIFRRKTVMFFPMLHPVVDIVLDNGKMGVDIIIVLRVILVV